MKRNLFIVLIGGLIALLGAAPASALITFGEVPIGSSNPSIVDSSNGLTVNFFGGSSFDVEDVYTDDLQSAGNPYLANGFDPDDVFDTFIGATSSGFLFDWLSFDFAWEGILPGVSTLWVEALSGAGVVDSMSISSGAAYQPLQVSFANGFDSVRIYDDLDSNGYGEFFHIDNFSFTKYTGSGPHPTPEPTSMLLLIVGVAGLAAANRKRWMK